MMFLFSDSVVVLFYTSSSSSRRVCARRKKAGGGRKTKRNGLKKSVGGRVGRARGGQKAGGLGVSKKKTRVVGSDGFSRTSSRGMLRWSGSGLFFGGAPRARAAAALDWSACAGALSAFFSFLFKKGWVGWGRCSLSFQPSSPKRRGGRVVFGVVLFSVGKIVLHRRLKIFCTEAGGRARAGGGVFAGGCVRRRRPSSSSSPVVGRGRRGGNWYVYISARVWQRRMKQAGEEKKATGKRKARALLTFRGGGGGGGTNRAPRWKSKQKKKQKQKPKQGQRSAPLIASEEHLGEALARGGVRASLLALSSLVVLVSGRRGRRG